MPTRLHTYQQLPWDGGVNSTVDPGVVPPQQAVQADNTLPAQGKGKKSRGGIVYGDRLYAITHRASSGTTRTLTLASTSGISTNDKCTVYHTDSFNPYYDGTHKITVASGTTLTYTATGSYTEATTAVSTCDVAVNSTVSTIGCEDFWVEGAGANTQKTIMVLGGVAAYKSLNSSLQRSAISTAGSYTATSGATQVVFETLTNKLVMAFDGSGNTPKYWDGTNPIDDLSQLTGSDPDNPDFSVCRAHLGRLWTNDKANPNRLHYSDTGTLAKWGGAGDSGALDINPGDGDPSGITAIFPPFRGTLFVAKRTKLYKVTGLTPETFKVEVVSSGIGCISHRSVVAVDQDDIMYASDRGWHFLSATDRYGDFEAAFASADIQGSFNSLSTSRKRYICGKYVPSLNIVAYGTSDSGDSVNTDVWVFHTLTKQWFRWPDVKCQSMMVRTENDSHRLYFGTDNGRLLKTQAGVSFDFGTTGKAIDDAITGSVVTQATKSPIALGLKTGSVYPAGNAQTETAFRNLVLYLRARGTYSVTANVTIDNYAPQTVTFSSSNTSALLGTTFTLGTSILGARAVLAPLKASLDGYGYGATVEITHASADQDLEIFGYGLEYETAENRQETLTASTAA